MKKIIKFKIIFLCFFFSFSHFLIFANDDVFKKSGIIKVNGEWTKYISDDDIVIDSEKISEKKLHEKIKFVKPEANLKDGEKNLLVTELFPDSSPKVSDVKQGSLGACCIFSTLSSVASSNPEFIKNHISYIDKNHVMVKLNDPDTGKSVNVIIDKTVPSTDSECAFVPNNCLWVHMYIKAFVAADCQKFKFSVNCQNLNNLHSYKSIESLSMSRAMGIVTGKEIEILDPVEIYFLKKEELYKKICETLKKGGIVLCDFNNIVQEMKFPGKGKKIGLYVKHAYSVLDVKEDENSVKFVCCRNPWGKHISVYDQNGKLQLQKSNDTDGVFWLKLDDFYKISGFVEFTTDKSANTEKKSFADKSESGSKSLIYSIALKLSKIYSFIFGKKQ